MSEMIEQPERVMIRVFGVVQGVGFRPYVYRLARQYRLTGYVSNQGAYVEIDAAGQPQAIASFLQQLTEQPPDLSSIAKVEVRHKEYRPFSEFCIKPSGAGTHSQGFIPRDTAVCDACLQEVFDPASSRYRYPLTNCTNCGPRYSIILQLPYDRESTTMQSFVMCPDCRYEYEDPWSRRFHAQPNCCTRCGPQVKLMSLNNQQVPDGDPIELTADLIRQGRIVAIKGIGGFHLCCDAENEKAVSRLRQRKKRPHKPLAVMVKDLCTASRLCFLSEAEEKLLTGRERPIVLANVKSRILPEVVAPGLDSLGIMLPYTPLHHLLFAAGLNVLVMTSANVSGYPLEYQDASALVRLKDTADFMLTYNRAIHIPLDDPVARVVSERVILSRPGRGFNPYSVPIDSSKNILGLGAEQKSTVCVLQNGYAHLSQYFGDLKSYANFQSFRNGLNNLCKILDFRPELVACDLHPDYLSTQYAKRFNCRVVPVQHHHAHMVSCMAEHGLHEVVLGVVYDGTGLGPDGTIWGGEFLLGDRTSYKRVGNWQTAVLPAGSQTITEPWRSAVGYLTTLGIDAVEQLRGIKADHIRLLRQALTARLNCYETSSMGRLFDCIAALVGLRYEITYDAQAAIELENMVAAGCKVSYDYSLVTNQSGRLIIEYHPIIKGVLKDVGHVSPGVIAAKFHNTVVNVTCHAVQLLSRRHGITTAVLSGGVFENRYLLARILVQLNKLGIKVYHNQMIPGNDSGIAVGQVAIAATQGGEG